MINSSKDVYDCSHFQSLDNIQQDLMVLICAIAGDDGNEKIDDPFSNNNFSLLLGPVWQNGKYGKAARGPTHNSFPKKRVWWGPATMGLVSILSPSLQSSWQDKST